MDRNLQFILDINKNNSTPSDGSTGTRSAFGTKVENGSTEVTTRRLSSDGKLISETKTTENYSVYPSNFTTFFKRNGSRQDAHQQYINYRGVSGTNDFSQLNTSTSDIADTSLTSIINWTKKYPALQLRNVDFAYLKDVGVNPPNRMVVLRRFPGPAPDDLFTCTMTPTNVAVGYIKFEDETALDISFGENWKTGERGGLLSIINDIFGKFESTGGKRLSALPTFQGSSNLDQAMYTIIAAKLGLVTSQDNPMGNPNLIHEAAIRATEYDGFRMDLQVKVTVEYLQKYIDGIDPQAAMMDALANCTYMGTSDAQFLVTDKGGRIASDFASKVASGDIAGLIRSALSAVSSVIRGLIDKVAGLIKDVKERGVDALKDAAEALYNEATEFVATMASKYRERIRGALGAMSGAPTAPWHVTFGNPKSPWFSMGNMVMTDCKLEVMNDFAFNDYPNKIRATYTLKPGRVRGAQEITSAFNAGKGRIYHKPPATKTVTVIK